MGVKQRKGRVIFVLEERKGIQHFLQALPHLRGIVHSYHIYGAGPYKDVLAVLVKELELDDVVMFFEPVTNVAELLVQYDIYVLLSYGEAFALGPIEAIASGIPIVVSNLPPNDEWVESSFGKAVEMNSPIEIKSAVEDIYANYDSMSKAAIAASVKYDWVRVCRRYESV